jgi:hypothetical protein
VTLPPGRARDATKPLRRSQALCSGNRDSQGGDDVDLEPDELGRNLGATLGAVLRPANLDRDVQTTTDDVSL